MSLPKVNYPINTIKIPSTNKAQKFRPFLVREEKILLIAKESENPSDILQAIKQVVNNCAVDKLEINNLAIFDLEYLFLKLRAMSVDNVVKVSYKDYEDGQIYEFDVDLNKIEVQFPKDVNNKIEITKDSGIILNYPSAQLYDDKEFINSDKDYIFELVIRCIDKIYQGDNLYEAKDYKASDLREFVENLDIKTFDKIREFLVNLPKMTHTIEYKNSLDHDRKIELTSLNDFFTFR